MSAIAPHPDARRATRPVRREQTPRELRQAQRRQRISAVPTRRPRPSKAVRVVLLSMFVMTLVMGFIGIVSISASAATAFIQARTIERQIAELTLEHDDLVAEVAALAAPHRVRDVAIGQLGLLEPEVPGFIEVDPAHMPPAAPKPMIRLEN